MRHLWVFAIFIHFAAHATVIQRDHVEARLITLDKNSFQQHPLGVHFKIDPEWHLYWKNSGDSGAAPIFKLIGGELKKIHWPYPTRLPVGPLTNYGYQKDVVFFLDILPQEKDLKLKIEWLVCKIDCIPGFGEFQINPSSVIASPALYSEQLAWVPQPNPDWQTQFQHIKNNFFNFNLKPLQGPPAEIKNILVFPEDGEYFQTTLPQIKLDQQQFNISMPINANHSATKQAADFTFVVHKTNGEIAAFTEQVKVVAESPSWWLGLIFAFLGGVILNLMPCVFPVLFLKAFSFLKESNPNQIKRAGCAYSFGVVLSFLLFGALLTSLRFSGEALGWGYQLQNSYVVFALALLFFLMGLNFYGFFEFGDSLTHRAGALSKNRFLSGNFGTGVLAVVVASPCTAPFMGTALGLTLLLPLHQSLLIFVFLGLGMAAPMLLLSYFPGFIQRLPRSGPWMIYIKQFLCFPLLATSLWLIWVLSQQIGLNAVFICMLSLLLVALSIWSFKISRPRILKILATLFFILSIFFGLYSVFQGSRTVHAITKTTWANYDEAEIEKRKMTQNIFVDFTASWCITCQFNKLTVLDTKEIQDFFKLHNVYLVRADWTDHDQKITQALEKFNRNSIPFYVFYNKMGKLKTLSEILTKDKITDLIQEEKK